MCALAATCKEIQDIHGNTLIIEAPSFSVSVIIRYSQQMLKNTQRSVYHKFDHVGIISADVE